MLGNKEKNHGEYKDKGGGWKREKRRVKERKCGVRKREKKEKKWTKRENG